MRGPSCRESKERENDRNVGAIQGIGEWRRKREGGEERGKGERKERRGRGKREGGGRGLRNEEGG